MSRSSRLSRARAFKSPRSDRGARSLLAAEYLNVTLASNIECLSCKTAHWKVSGLTGSMEPPPVSRLINRQDARALPGAVAALAMGKGLGWGRGSRRTEASSSCQGLWGSAAHRSQQQPWRWGGVCGAAWHLGSRYCALPQVAQRWS